VESGPVSVQQKLYSFLGKRLRHPDTHSLNLLNSSLAGWFRYYGFLEIIRNRYEEISGPYCEAVRGQFDGARHAGGPEGASSRSVTPDELREMQRLAEMAQVLHLDIESF